MIQKAYKSLIKAIKMCMQLKGVKIIISSK